MTPVREGGFFFFFKESLIAFTLLEVKELIHQLVRYMDWPVVICLMPHNGAIFIKGPDLSWGNDTGAIISTGLLLSQSIRTLTKREAKQ